MLQLFTTELTLLLYDVKSATESGKVFTLLATSKPVVRLETYGVHAFLSHILPECFISLCRPSVLARLPVHIIIGMQDAVLRGTPGLGASGLSATWSR